MKSVYLLKDVDLNAYIGYQNEILKFGNLVAVEFWMDRINYIDKRKGLSMRNLIIEEYEDTRDYSNVLCIE